MPTGTREAHTETMPSVPGPSPSTAPVVDTNVPVYPGAIPSGEGASMNLGVATFKAQAYTTSDSVDQVTAFYKSKLGPNAIITQAGQEAVLQLQGSNGAINIVVAADASSGKTKITVQSTTK
jgi:hypothetical protein